MTPPPRQTAAALLAAAAFVLALAGCGGGGDDNGASAPPATAPTAQAFPSASGKATLGDLVKGLPQGPNLAPSQSRLDTGDARFAFGLFDRGNKTVNGAAVAVYTASETQTDVRGPYVARFESLDVDRRFQSRTTASDFSLKYGAIEASDGCAPKKPSRSTICSRGTAIVGRAA